MWADPGDQHEVRCCSDTQISGWQQRVDCPWAESDAGMGGCHGEKTFAEAEAICASANARLCTAEELVNDCSRGTGCGFDDELIWSSDQKPERSPPPPLPPHQGQVPQPPSPPQSPPPRKVECGRAGNCPEPTRWAEPFERHEVRCCSDTALEKFRRVRECGLWVSSKNGMGGCQGEKTFAEAEAICASANARLCTAGELRAGCTRGTGCGFDDELIWSLTTN